MTNQDLAVLISEDDLCAAQEAWLAALLDGQPSERIALLSEDIERLTGAQSQQIHDDFYGDA